MAKAGGPNKVKRNKREELATAFAELFTLDHRSINTEHFEILKEVFSDKEIQNSALLSVLSLLHKNWEAS